MNRTQPERELAVLEAALEEEIGGNRPPDLRASIEQRRARRQTQPARRRWPAAAILAAGAAVLVAVFAMRTPDGGGHDPARLPLEPDGPRTIEEARSWLRADATIEMSVHAHGVVESATGAWVPLELHPLEGLFSSVNRFRIVDRDERARVIASLANAAPATGIWTRGGEYTLTVQCGERRLTVHIRGCARFPAIDPAQARLSCAIAGRDAMLPIHPDATLLDVLDIERLVNGTATALRQRGIAIGDAGLRTLSPGTKRIRCHGVTQQAVADLLRFDQLRQLDLQFSAELQRADTLREIARLPLRSLIVAGRAIDRDAVTAIGSMSSLEELFFTGPIAGTGHSETALWESFLHGQAAAVDDTSVIHLTGLQKLTELSIGGASITDDGLRTLATLPALGQLCISDAPNLRGEGFDAFHGHSLSRLTLFGCDRLSPGGIDAIASLPNLEELMIGVPLAADARGLTTSTGLKKLFVHGDVDALLLAAFGAMRGLRRFQVRKAPTLDDEDLTALHGATHLEMIEFISCPNITAAGRAALQQALPECRVRKDEW